jgi:hypothetical protein
MFGRLGNWWNRPRDIEYQKALDKSLGRGFAVLWACLAIAPLFLCANDRLLQVIGVSWCIFASVYWYRRWLKASTK